MGLVELPYLNIYRVKGRLYAYYRRGPLRQRLHGEVGSPEFLAAYQAIHARAIKADQGRPEVIERSLGDLIQRYRRSTNWTELKPSSRQDYEKALGPLEKMSHLAVKGIQRHHVKQILELYARKEITHADGRKEVVRTPRRANKLVTVLSILIGFAIELGWRREGDNPALGAKKLKVGRWRAWKDAEVERFLAEAPAHLRLACLLAVCTGQRGGDQVAMTWRAYDGTAIEVVQEKTGEEDEDAEIWIPVHPALKVELDTVNRTALHIITRGDGTVWRSALEFQTEVSHELRRMGMAKAVVWHGLRKTAARWLAEAGCAEREIMSITGHKSPSMVNRYTEQADQRRRANSAMDKMTVRWNGAATPTDKPKSGE